MKLWAQREATLVSGIWMGGWRGGGGHFRDFVVVVEPLSLTPDVNVGSAVPGEEKNSGEQQGTGDGCQTDTD